MTSSASLSLQPGCHTILVIPYQWLWNIQKEIILTRALSAGMLSKNRDSRPLSGFIACCWRFERQVLYTQLRWTVASWWHSSLVAISGVVCCSRETDDEAIMERNLNVTPKTTEHNLIVRIGNSEASNTNNGQEKLWRALNVLYCWCWLDWQDASRGLSAAAEPAYLYVLVWTVTSDIAYAVWYQKLEFISATETT